MTSLATITPQQPISPPQEEPKRRITAKVRTAVDAMVWQGLKRDEAAQLAGLKDNSLYVALARPDVRSYYIQQLEVLRTSERARNIHTLAEVRDQTSNHMARVQAVKALEQLDDSPQSSAAQRQQPGFVIVVNTGAHTPHMGNSEAKPLISQGTTILNEYDSGPIETPAGDGRGENASLGNELVHGTRTFPEK